MVVDSVSTGGGSKSGKAKKTTQNSTTCNNSKQSTSVVSSKTFAKKKLVSKTPLPATKGTKGKNSGEESKKGKQTSSSSEMVASTTSSTSVSGSGPRIQAQRKFAQAGNIYSGTANSSRQSFEGDRPGNPAKKQASVKRQLPISPPSGTATLNSGSSATKKLKMRPQISPPPNKRPKTEDFLTFLCFRGTPALPPDLAYLNYPPLPDELSFLPKKKSSNPVESIPKPNLNGVIHSEEEESLSKPSLPLPGNAVPSLVSKPESKDSTTGSATKSSKANQKSAESLAENPTKGIRATASSVLLSKMNSKSTGKQNSAGQTSQAPSKSSNVLTKVKPILSPTRSRLNEQDARFAMTALRSSFQYQRLASSKLTKKAKERTGILTRSKASIILPSGAKLCGRKTGSKFSLRGARKSPIISPSRNAPSPDIIFGVTSSSIRRRLPKSNRSSSTESEDASKRKSNSKSSSEESGEGEDEDCDKHASKNKSLKNTRSNSKDGKNKTCSVLSAGRSLRSGKELSSPSVSIKKETSAPNKKPSIGGISERRVGTRSAQRMTKSPLRELPMWSSKKSAQNEDSDSEESEEDSDNENGSKRTRAKNNSTDEDTSNKSKGKKKQSAGNATKKTSEKKKKEDSSEDDSTDDKKQKSSDSKTKRVAATSKRGKNSTKSKSEYEDESSESNKKKKATGRTGRRGSLASTKNKTDSTSEENSSENDSTKKKSKKSIKTQQSGSMKKKREDSSEEEKSSESESSNKKSTKSSSRTLRKSTSVLEKKKKVESSEQEESSESESSNKKTKTTSKPPLQKQSSGRGKKKSPQSSEKEDSSENESDNKHTRTPKGRSSVKKNKDESSEEEKGNQKKGKKMKKEETDDDEEQDTRTSAAKLRQTGRKNKETAVDKKSSENESGSDRKTSSKGRVSLRRKQIAKKEEKEQVKKRPSRKTKETAALCLGLYKFTTDEEESSEDEKSKKKKDGEDDDVEGSSSSSETKFLEKHYNASLKKEQQEKSKKKSAKMKTRPKRKESMKEESDEEDDDAHQSIINGSTKNKRGKNQNDMKTKTSVENEEDGDDDSTEEEDRNDRRNIKPCSSSKEASPLPTNSRRKIRQVTPTVGDRKMPGAARKSAAIVSRRRSHYSSSSSKEDLSSEDEPGIMSGDDKPPVKCEEHTKVPKREPKVIATEMRRLVSESLSPPSEPGSNTRRREQSVETEQCRLESPPIQPSSSSNSSSEDSSADSSGEESTNKSVTISKVTIAIQCDMDEDPEAEKLISSISTSQQPSQETVPDRTVPITRRVPPPPTVENDDSNDSVQEIGHVFATPPQQHSRQQPSTSAAPASVSTSSSAMPNSSTSFPGIFTAPPPPSQAPSSLDYNPFLSSFYTPLHLTPPAPPPVPPPNPFMSTHFQHMQQQASSAGAASASSSSSLHMTNNPLNTLSIPVSIPPHHPLSHSHHHLSAHHHPLSTFQSFQTSTIHHHHIRTTHTNLDNISLVRPPAIPGFSHHQPPLTRPLTGMWPQQPVQHAASSSTSSTASSYSAFRVPHLVPPGQTQAAAATVIHHQSTTVTQLPVSIVQPQPNLFQPHPGIHTPHTPHHSHHQTQQPGPSSAQSSVPSSSSSIYRKSVHSHQDAKNQPKPHSSKHKQHKDKTSPVNQSSNSTSTSEKNKFQSQTQQSKHQLPHTPPGYNIIKNLPNVSIVPKFDRSAQPTMIPGKNPSTSSGKSQNKNDVSVKKEDVKPKPILLTGESSGLTPGPSQIPEKKKPGRKKKIEQALILPQPTSPLTVRKDSTTPATYHPKKPLFKKEEDESNHANINDDGNGAIETESMPAIPSTSKKSNSKKNPSKCLPSGEKNSRSRSPAGEIPFELPKMQPNGQRDAPTFHPTDAEFEDPLKYIMKVQLVAGKYGIARIIPPKSFRPECNVEDDMRFTAYNHYVHRMWQRWGPNTAEATAIIENVRGSGVDTDELPAIIGGLEIDLALLYRTVRSFGGLKEVIEKEKWAKVADAMHVPKAAHDRASKLDGIYVKYVLPYEILSAGERDKLKKRVERSWCKRKERILKSHEREQGNGSHSSDSDGSNGSSDDEMAELDECIVKGKSTPLSSYYRVARNTQNMFFAGDKSSPSVDEVETEYWRLVRERNHPVTVYSGSIDCAGGVGWGFPMPTNKGNHHPWNLKVLANNQGSVLRSMGHVMGATVPTLHVSMLFTTYCWYRDPHSLPWVEYLHSGADKIWYSVPPEEERSFRSVLSALMPLQVQKNKKIWLASDSAMVPPDLLLSRGVPLVKAVQRPGEFLVVFPKAFTSAVCTGYLISESVCFAYPSWLSSCLQIFQDIRESKEPPVFPLEKLLITILQDARASLEVVRLAISPTKEVVKEEISQRKKLISLGVKLGGKLLQRGSSPKDSEGKKSASKSKAKKKRSNGNSANSDTEEEVEQCYVCNYLLWISMVRNTKTDSAMCLKHAIEHFGKHKADVKKSVLLYDMDDTQLEDLISNASNRCGYQSKPGSSAPSLS